MTLWLSPAILLLTAFSKISLCAVFTPGNSSAEHRLYRYLIKQSDYLKTMRPVRNHSIPVKVRLGMCVMMLEDVVERDQTMVMSVCIKMKWIDEFLKWDPRKFDGLQWMAVPVKDIWQPDIALVNSAEPYALTRKPAQADITFDGYVGYYPAGRLATKCALDITYFPMDYQKCEVRFESWVYPLQAIDIEVWEGDGAIDIKDLYTNHLWTIAQYYVVRDAIQYDELKFARLKFVFELKRKPLYFFLYIIFPLLLLSALQTLGHSLPVEHPGRMALLTALFIGSSVTQSTIASHVPKTSEVVSLIQIYSTIVNFTLFVSMVISFIMLYTLLRLPEHEPNIWGLLFNFFSITWSTRNCRNISTALANINKSTLENRISFWGTNSELAANDGSFARQKMANRQLVVDSQTNIKPLLAVQIADADTSYSTAVRRMSSASRTTPVKRPNNIQLMSTGEGTVGQAISPMKNFDARQQQDAFVAIDMSGSESQGEQMLPPNSNGSLSMPILEPKSKKEAERRKIENENTERHKKRWLIYVVALDKSIMYAVTIWNIFVPIILFVSIPRIQRFEDAPPGVDIITLNI